jgi:histidinol-phosphate aminotransferase
MDRDMIRKEVLGFKPYSPGLNIEEIKRKYGLTRVIKMASNENPLGTSPVVKEVIARNASLAFRYPRAGNPDLCAAIGEYLNVPAKNIVCGNGSDEIIDLVIRLVARPGEDNIVAFKPCFSIYELQSRFAGVEFRQVPLNKDFHFPWDDLLLAVDEKTKVVFITNPDNPSGFCVRKGELKEVLSRLPQSVLVVIDEAYIDFALPQEEYSLLSDWQDHPNLVVLRTFSKMFGLAGLRVGFAVLPDIYADYLQRVKLPFSVNILAEKAGIAALKDRFFYDQTLKTVCAGREFLSSELKKLGCKVFPSQANFLMFAPPKDAFEVFEGLLKKGIIIRPLKSYGLKEYLRVSIGTEEENKVFIDELREILNGSA